MSKPLGISLSINESGLPSMRLQTPNRALDAIWDAVQTAIGYGLTPKQFLDEAAEAWEQELKDQGKEAVSILTGRKTGW